MSILLATARGKTAASPSGQTGSLIRIASLPMGSISDRWFETRCGRSATRYQGPASGFRPCASRFGRFVSGCRCGASRAGWAASSCEGPQLECGQVVSHFPAPASGWRRSVPLSRPLQFRFQPAPFGCGGHIARWWRSGQRVHWRARERGVWPSHIAPTPSARGIPVVTRQAEALGQGRSNPLILVRSAAPRRGGPLPYKPTDPRHSPPCLRQTSRC